MVISSRGFSRVEHSRQGGALRPEAARAAIATISIAPTLLVVSTRSLRRLNSLGIMRRHDLCLFGVELKKASVPKVFFGRFRDRAVALKTASIYLTDLQRKFQGGLGISRNSFLDSLVSDVFSTTFLLRLDVDGWP